jgi:hypothetical protein
MHCNTRPYLVRSVRYDSLVGDTEIFAQISQCKRKLPYPCTPICSDYKVYVRLKIYTQNIKTCIRMNLSAKFRMIPFMSFMTIACHSQRSNPKSAHKNTTIHKDLLFERPDCKGGAEKGRPNLCV